MAIPKGYRINFNTLLRAAKAGQLALLECRERSTGRTVNAIVAVNWDGKEYSFSPFAQMYDSNPFELLDPPDPDGGFFGDEEAQP